VERDEEQYHEDRRQRGNGDEHMPHPHQRRTRFDHFAEKAAHLFSGGGFFAVSAVLVLVWLPTLWIMGAEPSQFLIQTITAIFTFLLVALLQNSQRRNEEALNIKLNAIAQGIADLMRERTGDDHDLHDNIERLTHTVGLEERVSTKRD
jgi:low affinity Fe/Cu permease